MEYYRFDHQLRLLFLDAISRIEIALREMMVAVLSAGSPASVNPQNVVSNYQPRFHMVKHGKSGKSYFSSLMDKVDAAYHASKGVAANHYLCVKHISEARFLPVWVFMEFATFGNLSMLISVGLKKSDVVAIANRLGSLPVTFSFPPLRCCTVFAMNVPIRGGCGIGIGSSFHHMAVQRLSSRHPTARTGCTKSRNRMSGSWRRVSRNTCCNRLCARRLP